MKSVKGIILVSLLGLLAFAFDVRFSNIVSETAAMAEENSGYWENPYFDWGKPGYRLLGGQGEHFHTNSFATDPDAKIDLDTAFSLFSSLSWPLPEWAIRGVHVGGYENTNEGYEWICLSAHNHRRTNDQYRQLLEYGEQEAQSYGFNMIRGSEVCPPHEGLIWNGLCTGGYDTYPNAFAVGDGNKVAFVQRAVSAETSQHHSIAVILHPQCGDLSGQNSLESATLMVQAGAELIEIFNGGWESGDDLCVNDHIRTGSENTKSADGNAESYWDIILSQGLRVWGCGSDDFHGKRKGIDTPSPSRGWSGNYVWMEILAPLNASSEELVRRLETGSFYVTQGVQIVNITVQGDTIWIEGDVSVDFIEAIGSVGGPVALGPLNDGDGDTGTLLQRSEGNVMKYRANPQSPHDNIYVRFRLVNTDYNQSFYYDEHQDGGGDVYAWTQPFFRIPARKNIPGDADGDRDVDIYDIVMIVSAYGSKKGEPRYLDQADFDDDGNIDIYDFVTACGNYGKSS